MDGWPILYALKRAKVERRDQKVPFLFQVFFIFKHPF